MSPPRVRWASIEGQYVALSRGGVQNLWGERIPGQRNQGSVSSEAISSPVWFQSHGAQEVHVPVLKRNTRGMLTKPTIFKIVVFINQLPLTCQQCIKGFCRFLLGRRRAGPCRSPVSKKVGLESVKCVLIGKTETRSFSVLIYLKNVQSMKTSL